MELLTMLIVTLITGVLSVVYIIRRQMTFWLERGVPYVKSFPIIGSLSQVFFRQRSFPDYICDLYGEFKDAKYYGMMDFNTPTLMIKDPELIRDLCVKNFESCPNHRSFVDERMDPIIAKNVFSLRGERWREVRSTLSPSFTASKMKFMFELVSKCSEDFVQYLVDHPEMTKSLNMKDAYTRYTNDVIATAAFGISVNSLENRDNEFYLRGKDATNFRGIIPMLKILAARLTPSLMRFMGIKFLSHDTDKFFHKLITETVKERDEKNIIRPDMIHLLMQARNNRAGIEITIDDIIGQAFIFFLAGFDTSSTFMTFLSHLLAYNQDVQEKLRNEIDEITQENNGKINYDQLVNLKYMEMVMNETLRLYPPAIVTDRVCVEPFKLPPPMPGYKELTVEKDMICWMPIYALHHDPKYFPNPDKFDPERFNDDNKLNIAPYTFMPFGVGPRKCIGERFATMETKIILAHLLQKFIIKPTDKSTEKIEFDKKNFNIAAKGGTWLSFQRRDA
nr:cytochrome P450 4AV17 [Meteorus pulchricornis]